MAFESIEDHIVILGWSERVQRIIRELRNDEHLASGDLKPILVITSDRLPAVEIPFQRVYVIYGQLDDLSVLERANLPRAASILIPSLDPANPRHDGETIFKLLAVIGVCPQARICVEMASANHTELLNRLSNAGLLQKQIEFVAVESIAERLMAQAAINRGVTRVYNHLISFTEDSNEIYVVDIPPTWVGRTFRELMNDCFERGIILVGFESGPDLQINPADRGLRFQAGDRAWFIAYNKAAVLRIVDPTSLTPADK